MSNQRGESEGKGMVRMCKWRKAEAKIRPRKHVIDKWGKRGTGKGALIPKLHVPGSFDPWFGQFFASAFDGFDSPDFRPICF